MMYYNTIYYTILYHTIYIFALTNDYVIPYIPNKGRIIQQATAVLQCHEFFYLLFCFPVLLLCRRGDYYSIGGISPKFVCVRVRDEECMYVNSASNTNMAQRQGNKTDDHNKTGVISFSTYPIEGNK